MLLSRVESLFEALFEGSIRRLLRPRLQPIEISHALERVMESQKVVGSGSVDVPNRYMARLNPSDFHRLEGLRDTIERDAAIYLERRARELDFHPIGAISVELSADPKAPKSFVRGEGAFDEGTHAAAVAGLDSTRRMDPVPVQAPGMLLVSEDGRELRVGERPLKLGRAADNDFVIRDVRVSRYHAVIEPTENGWVVRDLQSTNGTFVDGRRIERAAIAIASPAEISLGGCRLIPRER